MKNATRKTNQRRISAARRHSGQPQHQQAETKGGGQQYGAGGEGKQYGEGSYSGTRQYDKGLKEHLQTHDIGREARDAAPRSPAESKEMSEAERIGRSRARGSSSSRSPDEPETPEDLK